jgi:hypothetical protein
MCLFLKTIFEDKKNSFLPNYNWNIVESGVKHHNPFLPIVDRETANPLFLKDTLNLMETDIGQFFLLH